MKLLLLAALAALFTVTNAQFDVTVDETTNDSSQEVPLEYHYIKKCGDNDGDYRTSNINHNISYDNDCCKVNSFSDMYWEKILTYKCKNTDGELICMDDNALCKEDWAAIGVIIWLGSNILVLIISFCICNSYHDSLEEEEDLSNICNTRELCPLITFIIVCGVAFIFGYVSLNTSDSSDPATGMHGLHTTAYVLMWIWFAGSVLALGNFLFTFYRKKKTNAGPPTAGSPNEATTEGNYRKVRFNIA